MLSNTYPGNSKTAVEIHRRKKNMHTHTKSHNWVHTTKTVRGGFVWSKFSQKFWKLMAGGVRKAGCNSNSLCLLLARGSRVWLGVGKQHAVNYKLGVYEIQRIAYCADRWELCDEDTNVASLTRERLKARVGGCSSSGRTELSPPAGGGLWQRREGAPQLLRLQEKRVLLLRHGNPCRCLVCFLVEKKQDGLADVSKACTAVYLQWVKGSWLPW